jgi:DNA-binding NtrC family response regulator
VRGAATRGAWRRRDRDVRRHPRLPLDERVDNYEAWLCRDALERTRFKQKEAAALLGITYDQFRQRYRKYGLGKD